MINRYMDSLERFVRALKGFIGSCRAPQGLIWGFMRMLGIIIGSVYPAPCTCDY